MTPRKDVDWIDLSDDPAEIDSAAAELYELSDSEMELVRGTATRRLR